MVSQLIKRPAGLSTELRILLVAVPPISFRDIGRHRRGGPSKLACESVLLEIRKKPGDPINRSPQLPRHLPDLQIRKVGDCSLGRGRNNFKRFWVLTCQRWALTLEFRFSFFAFRFSIFEFRAYTRRRLGGLHPLWGMGVTSLMLRTSNPAVASARMADSRPAPGPFTRTSTLRIP